MQTGLQHKQGVGFRWPTAVSSFATICRNMQRRHATVCRMITGHVRRVVLVSLSKTLEKNNFRGFFQK